MNMDFSGYLTLLLLWVIPLILITRSKRTGKSEKLFWVLLAFVLPWISYIAYFVIAPIYKEPLVEK